MVIAASQSPTESALRSSSALSPAGGIAVVACGVPDARHTVAQVVGQEHRQGSASSRAPIRRRRRSSTVRVRHYLQSVTGEIADGIPESAAGVSSFGQAGASVPSCRMAVVHAVAPAIQRHDFPIARDVARDALSS